MAGQDDSLRHLTDHPAIWRGRDARLSGETLATGNTQLDALLPQGGWPLNSVTEIRIDHVGSGEMTLLLPAMRAITQQQAWVCLINPPAIPYAQFLARGGVDTRYVLWLKDLRDKDALWATERALADGVAAMAVAFLPGANEAQLRRLQLAAEQGGANGFALRSMRAAPAHLPLSISLNQANQQTTVKVHRGRGLPSRKQVVLS